MIFTRENRYLSTAAVVARLIFRESGTPSAAGALDAAVEA